MNILIYTFLTVTAVFSVFPLLWMLISSLRPATELFLSPPTLLPSSFTLD